MKVAVFLSPQETVFLDQKIRGIAIRYANDCTLTFFCRKKDIATYQSDPTFENLDVLNNFSVKEFEEVILLSANDQKEFCKYLKKLDQNKICFAQDSGRILPFNKPIDRIEYPHLETHAFNALSPRGDPALDYGCFYYFPYGYLYRFHGLGKTNEYGHRIGCNLNELEERPDNHKVIACFGGSAAYSIFCLDGQDFPSVLETALNDHCAKNGNGTKFTVLNFAQPGAAVLNELFQWVLFCHRIRPDIVIAHDGANDIGFAREADPALVEGWDIIYQAQLEIWSQILHDPSYTGPRIAVSPDVKEQPKSSPLNAIKAYIERKKQFARLVQESGARFVWGLQPNFLSKGTLSKQEHDWIYENPRVSSTSMTNHQQTVKLFDAIIQSQDTLGADLFVDCHTLFGNFSDDKTLMADVVHTTPDGDQIIGRHYADQIIATFSDFNTPAPAHGPLTVTNTEGITASANTDSPPHSAF